MNASPWNAVGREDLELSTRLVIAEAERRGHTVEVLDAPANFIRITGNGVVEYLRQATRTSADTYVSALLMENKKVTKLVLREAGIRVPEGRDYGDPASLLADWPVWENRDALVVKPNTTNFGTAVAILKRPFSRADFAAAADAAFREDAVVLVEEFIAGKEYRFLVIDGDAVAVLHRVPANVSGDGVSTIAELVAAKNADPRRGEGYVRPLEKLRLGPEEIAYLAARGLSPSSVPAAGRTVFLRENSNISTGGDSLDFTDDVHEGYKDLAVAAAAAAGAKICGVDMMIEDVGAEPRGDNYGIIELNFNPALHIHDFPYRGENRGVERFVLDLLGFQKREDL